MYSVCILLKVVGYYFLVVLSMPVMGLKKNWMAGGWVGGALSVFVWIFWNLFNFAKPFCAVVEIR